MATEANVRNRSDRHKAQRRADPENPTGLTGRPVGPALVPPAQVRRDQRRPLRLVGGILLIVLSALLGWAAWSQISTTESVVAVVETIPKGSTIDRSQLTAAQINGDSGLNTIPATELESLVGHRAATDLPAGSIVPKGSTMSGPVAAEGQALVGVLIAPGSAPVTGLEPGARVRLLGLAASQGQDAAGPSSTASLPKAGGLVVRVTQLPDGSGSSVDVAVESEHAAEMQRMAAARRVAIVVDGQR